MPEPTKEQVNALASAMWQLLDDMGADGMGVCGAAKAQARIAYEPFFQAAIVADPEMADCAPEVTLAQAQAVMRSLDY